MANYGSNFLQGAGAGAVAGATASGGNPIASIVGGALGGLAGLFGAHEQEKDNKKKKKILEQAAQQFNLTQDEIEMLMDDYYANPENFLGTKEDVEAYKAAIANYDPNAFVADFNEFEYDKDVDDFVNPYYDKIIDSTAKQVQHSAAGAGVGRGTGAANAIAQGVAEKNDTLYNSALNQYNTDRATKYSEWSGNITALQNRLNALKAGTDTKIAAMGNLANDYTQQQQQMMQDSIAAKQARSSGNLSLANMGLMI